MSNHSVTITWESDGLPWYTFACTAPADALCHAQFDCQCEAWYTSGVEDGRPWHSHDGDGMPDDVQDRHFGTFVPDCGLSDWFDNTDEPMRGTVTIPVEPRFVLGGYEFHAGGAA